jgi:DNA-binding CsgD family transcriptional regulator
VLATWVDSQGIDDTAQLLGISNRRVLQHLRQARHLLNVPHNGKLVAVVLSGGVYTRTFVAAR